MKAKNFDKNFDEGKDVTSALDLSKARRPMREQKRVMERYKNLGGDSGVCGYEIGSDFIRVQFNNGSIYRYTCWSAGSLNIKEMKRLAQYGEGLSAYIRTTVRKAYECKER